MTDAIGIKGHILQADALRITPADPDACADDSCHADDPGGSVDADRGGAEVGCRIDPQDRGALPLLAMLGLLGVAGGSRRRGATRVRPR
jgi:hypothetical protein